MFIVAEFNDDSVWKTHEQHPAAASITLALVFKKRKKTNESSCFYGRCYVWSCCGSLEVYDSPIKPVYKLPGQHRNLDGTSRGRSVSGTNYAAVNYTSLSQLFQKIKIKHGVKSATNSAWLS